jgi:hypothetical protein
MSDLLEAAKAVIEELDEKSTRVLSVDNEDRLRAAVERAEEPPTGFDEWWSRQGFYPCSKKYAKELWEAAQATERERAKVLLIELKNIANSKPSEWDDEVRDQFEEWVKNRAHAAIVKYEESK